MTANQKAAIVRRLAELTETGNGVLRTEVVVTDARSPDSPLHVYPGWDWDDASAAHKHRLSVAGKLIRSMKVHETINRRTITIPVYVRNTDDASVQGYRPTATLLNERDKALATLRDEFNRIAGAMRRSKNLAAYLGLENELAALLASVDIFIEASLRQAA